MVGQFEGTRINRFAFHTSHETVQRHRIVETWSEIYPGPLGKETRQRSLIRPRQQNRDHPELVTGTHCPRQGDTHLFMMPRIETRRANKHRNRVAPTYRTSNLVLPRHTRCQMPDIEKRFDPCRTQPFCDSLHSCGICAAVRQEHVNPRLTHDPRHCIPSLCTATRVEPTTPPMRVRVTTLWRRCG